VSLATGGILLPAYTDGPAQAFIGTIHIPLEVDPLGLNKTLHWAKKAKLTKQWRAYALLMSVRYPAMAKVDVTLTWFVKIKRTRDEDNMARLLKCLCDGLVDSGVVPDDAPQYMGKKCRIEPAPKSAPRAYMELRIEMVS
jgi:crossover junction endodeoxyribonuclease RusA